VGAIPDFVEDGRNGFLVEPGDIPGIANALLQLMEDPALCRSFGEASFQLTRERYSWETVGATFKQNILRTLGEPVRSLPGEVLSVKELPQ
jgi:glycosyltransferase involved in cell wall biosynthesis